MLTRAAIEDTKEELVQEEITEKRMYEHNELEK
jgi:hypothetical protein